MTKMTIAKWAVAAMLAVPAVPMFGKTIKSHKLASTHARHHTLVTTGKKHRVLHHKTSRHTALTSTKAGRKMSTSLKHTAKPASAHPTVEAVNPPTIDGMRS